jgi:hypothetical protein
MPRTRAMVLTAIWQDEDFIGLKAAQQWLYLFLLSQPDVNHLGVLPLLPRRWAQTTPNMTESTIMEHLGALAEARFVVVDDMNGAVLIRTFMRHDGLLKQPNVLRAARSELPGLLSPMIAEVLHQELTLIDEHDLPESVGPILATMRAQLKGIAAKGSGKGSAKGSGNPSEKGSAKGSEYPSTKGSENPLGTRDKGLGVSTELAVPTRARARGTRLSDDFAVTPDMVAWFHERCPGLDGKTETEKFRNYWRAKSGQAATKLDWPATWRNWMLQAYQQLPRSPAQGQAQRSTGELRAEAAIEAGKRLQERLDAEGRGTG